VGGGVEQDIQTYILIFQYKSKQFKKDYGIFFGLIRGT
jgi:hypothetical protein